MKNLIKDRNGKISSKRVAGLSCFIIGLGMGITTGFGWYSVDTFLILSILGCGTGCLGLGAFEKK